MAEQLAKPKQTTLMAASCWVMLVLCLLSAALQYNDPDPWRWAAIYACVAALSAAQLAGIHTGQVPLIVAVAVLLWAASLLPSFLGQVSTDEIFASLTMRSNAVEQAREAGGLLLLGLWALVLWRQSKCSRSSR